MKKKKNHDGSSPLRAALRLIFIFKISKITIPAPAIPFDMETTLRRKLILRFLNDSQEVPGTNFRFGQLDLPGGGGYSTNFYTERLRLKSNPFPFMYHFSRKRYPFRIPSSIDKWYPFHIPCLELSIPFTAVNALYLILNRPINRKNRTFSRLYKAIKFSHMLALVDPFTDPLQISLRFRILQQVKSLPSFIYLRPDKSTPFKRSLLVSLEGVTPLPPRGLHFRVQNS